MDKERPISPLEIEAAEEEERPRDHLILEDDTPAPPPLPESDSDKETTFRKELENLINRYSMENGSDTPDFILAEFLSDALKLFDTTVRAREKWYGREKKSDGTVL